MASFIPSKKTEQDFNGGVKYIDGIGDIEGDAIQAETLNNVIESQLYTQEQAENAVINANNAVETADDALDRINEAINSSVSVNGTYPNMTVGKATSDGNGNNISETYIPKIEKGVAEGVATLGTNAYIPDSEIPVYYGTCPTASETTSKIVTLSNITESQFSLRTGSHIIVRFTYSINLTTCYLNVNGTGIKLIRARNGNALSPIYLLAGTLYEFIYDGTYWRCVNPTPSTMLLGATRTNQHDFVKEYYISSDGLTWYRRWASGWLEQGGTLATSNVTVTYPLSFSSVDSYILVVAVNNDGNACGQGKKITAQTGLMRARITSGTTYSDSVCWYACGI